MIDFSKHKSAITGIVIGIGIMVVAMLTAGVNDNGQRTVVQWPNGTTFVKFSPGLYFSLFGSTEEYPDVITLDYDDDEEQSGTIAVAGINVRYQDGGTGTTYGKLRIALPNTEEEMLKLHRAVRSPEGLASKLLLPTAKEAHNMTAGLMTSEAAYAEQRGTYTKWVTDQLRNGPYETTLKDVEVVNEAGQVETKAIPVIVYNKNGQPVHTASVFSDYSLTIASSQVTNWSFEAKTLKQISDKRNATMAIITAKAEAERAKQDAITAEEQGKAAVMKAKYEKEEEKVRAVVDAEKAKEVAVIAAQQQVDVAEQQKLEQEQKKLAMIEYEKAEKARGRGDAAYKKMTMEADGYAQQKLETLERIHARYADAVGKHKLTPDVVMGSSGESVPTPAMDMINMLNVKLAKDLAIDMTVKK